MSRYDDLLAQGPADAPEPTAAEDRTLRRSGIGLAAIVAVALPIAKWVLGIAVIHYLRWAAVIALGVLLVALVVRRIAIAVRGRSA
jgi:hypothetical protein